MRNIINTIIDWDYAVRLPHGSQREILLLEAGNGLRNICNGIVRTAQAGAPTPDRSGEADKTGTGLAEGESRLPRSGRPNDAA